MRAFAKGAEGADMPFVCHEYLLGTKPSHFLGNHLFVFKGVTLPYSEYIILRFRVFVVVK